MAKTKVTYDKKYALPIRIDIGGSFHLLTESEATLLLWQLKNTVPVSNTFNPQPK